MAAKEHVNPLEREIPVFTVLKNNCILKNIFLLDNPPTLSSENLESSGIEEILVVGRHPDCNIKLEHPSISRFHLQINSLPSSHSLFVTDLSSGKKIMPGVKVKLNEGDTLSLGSSSRLYQLNWVPYSLAYDVDHPFVPLLDSTADSMAEKSESCEDDQVHNLSENVKARELLFSDENEGSSSSKEEISYSGDLYDPFCKKEEHSDSHEDDIPSINTYKTENENCPSIVIFPSSDSHKKLSQEENETDMNLQKMSDQSIWSRRGKSDIVKVETSQIRRKNAEINMPLLVESIFHETEYSVASPGHSEESYNPDKENSTPDFLLNKCKSEIFSKRRSISNSSLSRRDEEENFMPDKENMTPETRALRFKMNSGVIEEAKVHNLCKSSPLKRAGNNHTNQEKSIIRSLVKETEYNVASPGKSEESYNLDKENHTPDFLLNKCKGENFSKRRSISNSSLSRHDEEEIFTPDKENMTPETRALRFKMNSGVIEEKVHNLCKSSPLKRAGNNNQNQEKSIIRSLVKESKYQDVLQERKRTSSELKSCGNLGKLSAVLKSTEDREPFRPLSLNSPGNERANSNKPPVHEVDGRSSGSITSPCHEEVDCSNGNLKKERKKWTIIVDTGCLLNTQSRKELQLLRGLKGTTMVVPRIVVRELDCMLRQRSFFKRTNEVSSALQWIEDCTSNTKWWIHVQSSAEENTLIPPTPPSYCPSSPQWCNGESFTFSPFGLREITTPTPEDHILECAQHFKQTKNDEQTVLLSNDVTLKIKAMADGVICETAEEFRRSLVNPFSKRFLYADSSPRGPTWSCKDDTVLKETYYPSPSKKLTKSGEGVKGLKLILLHNSNFGQITQSLAK